MTSPPVSVAVLGSCISRDVFNTRFNPTYKSMWDCVLMQNQSSLISIMSEPFPIPEEQLGEAMGDYAKEQVRNDTSRSFLGKVIDLAPDYLIVDFFGDVHFGVLEVSPGQFVTDNRWMLHKTDWHRDRREAGELHRVTIQDDTERYLELWQEALTRLVAHLAQHLPQTTVIVHRGHNASRFVPESGERLVPILRRKQLFKIDIELLNAMWRRLDDTAAQVEGWESIDLTEGDYPSFVGHPWGVFYVHYTLDYYDEFLAALNAIHLCRVLEPGSAEQSMAVQLQAARERAHHRLSEELRETDRLRRRAQHLQGQLREAGEQAGAQERSLLRRAAGRVRGLLRRP